MSLSAPSVKEPVDERRKAYLRLRPAAFERTVNVHPQRIDSAVDVIELSDGTRVHHFEDLLPVLSEDTKAARSVREAGRSSRWSKRFYLAALASFAGGLVYAATRDHNPANSGPGPVTATLVIGGAVLVLPGWYYQSEAEKARVEAFRALDASLRASLNLCVDHEQRILDCDSVASPGPPGQEMSQ